MPCQRISADRAARTPSPRCRGVCPRCSGPERMSDDRAQGEKGKGSECPSWPEFGENSECARTAGPEYLRSVISAMSSAIRLAPRLFLPIIWPSERRRPTHGHGVGKSASPNLRWPCTARPQWPQLFPPAACPCVHAHSRTLAHEAAVSGTKPPARRSCRMC